MDVIDLTAEHEELYLHCLEDWSEEMREAGDHKRRWYRRMRERGLRVKLARDGTGTVGGMIQYLPIEEHHLQGQDLHSILCIWVHGYQEGRGNFQKQGMGRALLHAAEEDSRAQGKRGSLPGEWSFPSGCGHPGSRSRATSRWTGRGSCSFSGSPSARMRWLRNGSARNRHRTGPAG